MLIGKEALRESIPWSGEGTRFIQNCRTGC